MMMFKDYEGIWLVIGFFGTSCFFLRFLIQWIVSERRKESTIPVVFWHLSLLGALSILIYAIHRKDPVFIIGQSMGLLVYTRNLMLIHFPKLKFNK